MSEFNNYPPQQLPFIKKNKEWRRKVVDWADTKSFFNYSLVRKSVIAKKINYDLVNGKVHMQDIELVLNPDSIKAGYIPDKIQHYPIINSKLNVLRGEEFKRVFDYKVIVTNPNAITEKENSKKEELFQKLQEIIQSTSLSEEDFNNELEKLDEYYNYEWQDLREIRANSILNHYVKEYNIPLIFNTGFMDAMINAEEIYQCDIVGGEPIIERVNPLKIRVFKSGYSSRIEDADVVILEDYWTPSRIVDTYYDVLTSKDIEYIENIPTFESRSEGDMSNLDERDNFILASTADMQNTGDVFFDPYGMFSDAPIGSRLYYDKSGNIRVLRVYWKSRRRILKVKSYDPQSGEEVFNFYPEDYKLDTNAGEEAQSFWINEAWEGTKIGKSIYVNMRPKLIQYNRLSNPSRCHFGIIGSVYNLNDSKPYSLVDMMKPYSYMYDAIHDRLNKAIAANWGRILELDLAQVPDGWEVDKWMYYAKVNKIAVKDSFKEGNRGQATGKLAGGFANNSRGVIDAETGSHIQHHINLLEFIKIEMSEVAGISRQREGQISNRETVGGIERSTLQSSYITEWLYSIHDDVKRRSLECFLETAKIAFKGRSKKFQYILSDMSTKIMDIDGDEFAEADYGLVVDNSDGTQLLNQKIDVLVQAALQNQALNFSTIMKLYTSNSISEKIRMVENSERSMQESQSQSQQQHLEQQQQMLERESSIREAEMELRDALNVRDNETKILIANIKNVDKNGLPYGTEEDEYLEEEKRQFNVSLDFKNKELEFKKDTIKKELNIKQQKNK